MRHLPALLLAGAMLSAPALAQTTERVRGTITATANHALTIATREGDTITVTLADPLTVTTLKPVAFSDVKPGSFIATTAIPGPDGVPRAVELRVFPESMRGNGEGHRDYDLAPGSTMTNATVSAEVNATSGHDLTLSYQGGNFTVRVPPDLPILTPVPASLADLKPGAAVVLTADRAADGSLAASRVTVGTDGIKPGM